MIRQENDLRVRGDDRFGAQLRPHFRGARGDVDAAGAGDQVVDEGARTGGIEIGTQLEKDPWPRCAGDGLRDGLDPRLELANHLLRSRRLAGDRADELHAGEDLVQVRGLDHDRCQTHRLELRQHRSDMRLRRQNQIRCGGNHALQVWLEVAANLGFLPGFRRIGRKRVDAGDPLLEPEREEHLGVAWRDRHDTGR